MKKITTLLLLVFFVASSMLMGQNTQSYVDLSQEAEIALQKEVIKQKDAALGPVTFAEPGAGRAMGDLCTDPYAYGAINGPSQSGSIVSYGEQWYSFTGTENMTVTASLCASNYDTKLEIWYDCNDATYAFYNDDACGTQSEITGIPFVAGETYYAKVYGYSSSSGNYTLSITGFAPPPPVTAYPYVEPFTGTVMPTGWTNLGPDMWKFSGTAYYGANVDHTTGASGNYAWVDDSSPYTNPSDLDTRVFDLTSITSTTIAPTLGFWYWIGTNNNAFSTLYVDIFDGTTWHNSVGTYTYSGEWVEASIDLTVYSSATTQIRFRGIENTAGFNCDICLDDVSVRGLSIGDFVGTVTANGMPVDNAEVGLMDGSIVVHTDAAGQYSIIGLEIGDYDMYAFMDGMNYVQATGTITAGMQTQMDFNLSPPVMVINPLFIQETLNPEEVLTKYIGIQNVGNGDLYWTAEVVYPVMSANSAGTVVTSGNTPAVASGTGFENSRIADLGGRGVESGRDLFECNAGSFFGNSPAGSPNASWSQYNGTYQMYQQVNGISDTWSTVTYWGVFLSGTPTTEDHFIGVYADGGSAPGAELYGLVLPLDPIATGEVLLGSYPIYQWIANIDPQTETDFWVSCQATSQMYWCWSPTGSGNSTTGGDPLAVCIEGGSGVGGWLTLSEYEGSVTANGGTQTIGATLNASGTQPGEVYTADIVFSAQPNVSQTTVPVVMIINGDPLSPVTDLTVDLMSEVTGEVYLSWTFVRDVTFEYFLVFRDGVPLGSTTDTFYTDFLPDYGEYCYTVQAIFTEGGTAPAGPECVMWPNPTMVITDEDLYGEVWPDYTVDVTTTIQNVGVGTLAYAFPNYVSGNRFDCDYQVEMTDDFGDGWNGGYIDLYVEGVLVGAGLEVPSGTGPVYFTFNVNHGDEITTTYTPGGWPYENEYNILDCNGEIVYTDGANGSTPTGIPAGALYAVVPTPSFITIVNPADGFIGAGDEQEIMPIRYDATGFVVGTYTEWLHIASNDPNRMYDSIFNTMVVYEPATLYGVVTDCNTGQPMANVTVTAGMWSTETNGQGYYEFFVDEGTYDVDFTLVGFDSYVEVGVFAPQGVMTEVNASLCESPYAVDWVWADPNEADTECLVEWSLPMGPYELIYDDGSAEDFFAWVQLGGASAVRFTPAGYPSTVVGGRVFVGDGNFPVGGNFIGSQFAAMVIDDDGAGGMPGTVLDSVPVTVNNFGWVDFFGAFGATFNDGDFYVAMVQLGSPPNVAPVGVDTQIPISYRSYTRQAGMGWMTSIYQDFMIRAYVDGPNQGVVMNVAADNQYVHPQKPQQIGFIATSAPAPTGGMMGVADYRPMTDMATADRDLVNYTVAMVDGFNPSLGETPADGTINVLGNTANNEWNDLLFGGYTCGYYAYAVRANYDGSNSSEWAYSNIVGHCIDNVVTVNIELCDGNSPEGAEVTLFNSTTYPFATYTMVAGADGIVVFDSVIDGTYDVLIAQVGYTDYFLPAQWIYDDVTINVILTEKAYPARNLMVDPLTSVATWDEPIIIQMRNEGFEGGLFPPDGWQAYSDGDGWFRTEDGSSGAFPIPAGDGYYACSNDDANSSNDGDMDYLITPALDLRESDDFAVYFDHFFTGAYSQAAYVEYSTDNGATWTQIASMSPVADWSPVEVSLAGYGGATGPRDAWIAFHADDNGQWASGWAVDNVAINNGPSPYLGYYVFLDDVFVADLPADVTSYAYGDLEYGVTYTAAVAAKYACGLSDKIYYTWNSTYLYPPRNLYDEYIYGTNEVPLKFNPPMTGDGIPMMANATVVDVVVPDGGVNADAASTANVIEYDVVNNARDTWDLQFTFPNAEVSEAGVETDGYFIYTAVWNSGTFVKYDLDGTMLETFTIGGVSGVRDMAYDGQYFYGAAAATTMFVMDFETQSLVTTFTAPTACRALAYNDDSETFYGNNWSTDITEFDDQGNFVNSFSAGGLTGIYGMAWDGWTDSGQEYLWVYDQGADDVHQFTLPDGTMTGFAFDAGSIGVTGIAGGLFTQCGIVEGTVTLGGNGQGDLIWGVELATCTGGGGPQPGVIPTGLSYFEMYRDAMHLDYIPYEGQATDEWILYVDNNLMPNTYAYDVSAWYDLTDYGFPGEEAESAWEGTVVVDVVWGFDLPFYEEWDQGSFDFNGWMAPDENWVINSQLGNGEPSAEFTWDPLLEDGYVSSLTSSPLNGDMLTEGEIWFDFEVALEDRTANGEEMLMVEVYDGAAWNEVASFSNDGSFDWDASHIDITNHAMSRVFQVRFSATGMNSFDVVSWFVDNIAIYRTCEAPSAFLGEYDGDGMNDDGLDFGSLLTWEAPDVPLPVAEWLHWDDGVLFSGIGLTDGGTFSVAARWDAGQLSDYDGTSMTKVQFALNDDACDEIVVKIWTGANAGTMIFEETVAPVAGTWVVVDLPSPIALDVNDELWVGYTVVNQVAGGFPAGTDAGPAVAGYGDMITTDGSVWDPLSGFGLDYNWSVQVYVEEMVVSSSTPASIIETTVYDNSSSSLSQGAIKDVPVAVTNTSRYLSGFNVYRMGPGESDYTFLDLVPYEDGVTEYSYYDQDPYPGSYPYDVYYRLNGIWESDTDYCESPWALDASFPLNDFVHILITDVADHMEDAVSNLYPNPATDMVNVTSSQPITHITVINYVGQVMYDADMNDVNAVELNTTSFEAGVYVVQIDTQSGVITKRVTIVR